jgi:hypothetical protein
VEAKILLQRINIVQRKQFSHDKNILLVLEKNVFLGHLCLRVLVGNPTLTSLDLSLTALLGIAERMRKILTYTQKIYNKSKP